MIAGDLTGLGNSFNQFSPEWFFTIRNICDSHHISIMKVGVKSMEVEQMIDNLKVVKKKC